MPPVGEEVLLRVEAAGVCHSDVHIWDGHFDLGDFSPVHRGVAGLCSAGTSRRIAAAPVRLRQA
jgi:Zn-dependent alcohol dehydrogenase